MHVTPKTGTLTLTLTLAERMRAAVVFGAALAAAGGCQADPDPGDDAGTGGQGGAGGRGGQTVPPPDAGPSYPPAPEPGACPPDDGSDPEAFSGPCCDAVECYEPPPGEACPEAAEYEQDNVIAGHLGHDGLGSGECLCGVDGPWDPTSAEAFSNRGGRCCYTISIQWCTGRPLVVAGVARVAPLVRRADWT